MNKPDLLGHYEITTHMGSGAYSETFRAVDIALNRTVALKLLRLESFPKEVDPLRFLSRVQLASDLVHPHLAWVWETGEVDGTYYIAERFIEGQSLGDILKQSGPLGYEQALKITNQIAQGLEYAHARGLAHGDIKPSNILVHPELGAVLSGFGPALAIQAFSLFSGQPHLWGAGHYTAPEIWQGKRPDAASDQYALACNFAEALSGEKLFEAPTLAEIKEEHLADFKAPINWAVLVPWPAAKAIKRALERDPLRRFQGIRTFAEAPGWLANEMIDDPQLIQEREQQARLWQEMQEKARKEAEEASRLSALENAKLEMEEELQRQTLVAASLSETTESDEAASMATPMVKPRRRGARLVNRLRWLLWIGLMLGITVLLGLWLNQRATNDVYLPSATPNQAAIPSPASPSPQATTTTQATATKATAASTTSSPTTTRTKSATPTSSKTIKLTSTLTLTPTPTRTPDSNNDNSISNTNWPLSTDGPAGP